MASHLQGENDDSNSIEDDDDDNNNNNNPFEYLNQKTQQKFNQNKNVDLLFNKNYKNNLQNSLVRFDRRRDNTAAVDQSKFQQQRNTNYEKTFLNFPSTPKIIGQRFSNENNEIHENQQQQQQQLSNRIRKIRRAIYYYYDTNYYDNQKDDIVKLKLKRIAAAAAASTSINGFNNLISRNNVKEKLQDEASIQSNKTKKKNLDDKFAANQPDDQQRRHNHRIRSILDASNVRNSIHQQTIRQHHLQQQQHQLGRVAATEHQPRIASIRLTDRLPWFEPIAATTIFSIALIGIVIVAIVFLVWLKTLLFQSSETTQPERLVNTDLAKTAPIRMERKKVRKDFRSVGSRRNNNADNEVPTSLRNIVLNALSFDNTKPADSDSENISIDEQQQQPSINNTSTRVQSPPAIDGGPSLPPSPLASHIGESLSIPRPPTPIPLAIVCAQIPIGGGGGGARNSPKLSTVHDKENESPISGELLANSPKKKLNENILAEQNSPRIIETAAAATRFSFSPKQLNKHRRPATPTSTAQQNTINSSPLLSSAVYKHGNYFKFPEVDCLTPDKLINSCPAQTQPTSIQTGPIPAAAAGKLTVVGNQAARRARLKSISLDSEGARLVEDNLGIPVEELMEIANQSPPEFNSSDESCFREETVVQTQRKQNDKKIAASTPTSTNKLNRTKNKNNLTINIETEEPHSINNNNNAISTPKTPTLNQTKQKAVSLDSSDSSSTTATTILYGCRQSSSTVVHHHHHPYYQGQQRLATSTTTTTTTTKSLLHVSSTSMPTTPQRNRPTRKKLLTKTVQKSPTTIDKSIEIVGDDETTDDEDVGGGDDNDDGGGIVFEEDEELSDEPIDEPLERPQPTNNLLGTNLQNQKCNALSLSNNNLKTLPEVMTLSDFSTPASTTVAQPDEAKPKMTAARSNILQRRGSNHSLTLNLNSSFGNLTKGLSVSNYSLGSFNGSNYNLNHHLSHNQQIINQPSTNSSTQSIAARGCSSSQGNILLSRSSQPTNPVAEAGALTKKNLLQRRGSNTSLTLNIKGSSDANLSRFNSHSSLNIAASTQHHHHHHHHNQNNQLHQSLSQNKLKQQLQHQHGPGLGSKRGLLERRNSNASLTLNVQGLSISNCNLRGSACSLSSILNPDFKNSDPTINTEIDIGGSTNARRKFLSSENLNSVPQCTKLNQTHVRNSTKTCFGSVSDLKPANELTGGVNHPSDSVRTDEFEQTALCSCTGVRNITTKPLSPQSTSEDFKMYLANIQLLQNATNCLSDEHLRKLHFVFQRSYQMKPPPIADCELQYGRKTIEPPPPSVQHFSFNVSPTDDEQKHLVRTLHEEFWDLPTNHQEKPLVFGSQTKNRYKTILPNEHSRVILDQEIGSLLEVYINANYIKGPEYTQNSYIATQGPLPNTIYDFWLMVDQNIAKLEKQQQQQQQQQQRQHHQLFEIKFDQAGELKVRNSKYRSTKKPQQTPPSRRNSATVNNKCQKIIMLTNFIENNQQKCSFYFPIDENQTIFVTARDERYENDGLARFYAKYLNWKNGVDTQEFEVEFEIGDGDHDDGGRSDDGDSPLRKSQIPSSNYFVLKNAGLVSKDGFTIRKIVGLHVSTGRNDLRGCVQQLRRFVAYHYWFPDWPDHRSPADINVLLDMSLHLLDSPCRGEFMKFDPIPHDCDSIFEAIIRRPDTDAEPLPIIHCSAGIGRTGCLAAILNGIRQIRASIRAVLKPWNYELTARALEEIKMRKNYVAVDVLGIVCNLRLQRGGMVQNSEQYELIHRALCLYQARIDEELTAWDRKIIVQGMDDQSESNDEDDEVDQTTIL